MFKYCLAAILGMAAVSSLAQVKVVDSQPTSGKMPPPRTAVVAQNSADASASAAGQQSVELYYQLQALQREVQELRGLVEEQAFEIKRLKQQRMDDYLDLDRRLSELSSAESSQSTSGADGQLSRPISSEGRDELVDYRSAIDLVLKKQDYDQGIVALEKHLADYPDGRYAANAQYWLGQIHLLRNELEKSRQWFVAMLEAHPDHQKAPEAKFKLGKVYDLLGDKSKARALLKEVEASNTNAAGLAREYLRQNFPS